MTAIPTPAAPIRLADLPALLGPCARTAPVYVYLLPCGNLKATRLRLPPASDDDLILVMAPRGTLQ